VTVTFRFLNWRSLSLLKGHVFNIPKRSQRLARIRIFTPLKFNMEPENDGFQKESPFPEADLQVPC